MTRPPLDEPLMRYLLGTLPEDEQARLEQQFLRDEVLYEELVACEEELLFDYARGDLPPDERQRVERRLIVSDQDRERVAFAEALVDAVARDLPGGRAAAPRAAFFRRAPRWAEAVAAVALIAAGIWLVTENLRLRRTLEDTRSDRTARERTLSAQIEAQRIERDRLSRELERLGDQSAAPAPVVALSLVPGLVRAAGDLPRLQLPNGPASVRLELALPADARHQEYDVNVRTAEGALVWREDRLAARPDGARSILVVTIPANAFSTNDYEVVVQGRTGAGRAEEVADYYLGVRQ